MTLIWALFAIVCACIAIYLWDEDAPAPWDWVAEDDTEDIDD